MNPQTIRSIDETHATSARGESGFGQVLEHLIAAGVESYHVDYRAGRVTYYLPDGQTHAIQTALPAVAPARSLDRGALVATIRMAQAGQIRYPEFARLSMAAGCVAYTVWINGRHVSYAGRDGETHVERFP